MVVETSSERFERLVRHVNRRYNDKENPRRKIESKTFSLWSYFLYSLRHLFKTPGFEVLKEHETTLLSNDELSEKEEELILQASDWKRAIERLQRKEPDTILEETQTTVAEELIHARQLFSEYKDEFIKTQQLIKK